MPAAAQRPPYQQLDNITAELLNAIALGTPKLRGSKCVGHQDIYDRAATREPGSRRARAAALALCQSCPALAACRRWADSLEPSSRPRGVLAGRIEYTDRVFR